MRNSMLPIWTTLVGLVLCGCQGMTQQQRAWLTEGERSFDAGRYDEAIRSLTRFVGEAGDQPELGRALYVRGLAYARSQQREPARADLAQCVRVTEDREVRWRAYSVLGTLDYEDERWESAGRAYAAAVELAPAVPPTDTLLFRLGVCHERTGRWDAARAAFERVVREYPAGVMAEAAGRRVQIRAGHFAVQCGVFARETNANQQVLELERAGVSAYVKREPRHGVMMYVVLVGRYAEYEEALRELGRIKGHVPTAVLWP